jgi:dTDP-4-dehydrorhamnose 3,5-epimerase
MDISATAIPDILVLRPRRFADHRGFFSETFNARAFAKAGLPTDYVQDNHSLSRPKGTVRGLHFQIPPFAQAKLVRVVKGAMLDVAVDLRCGSPTYRASVSVVVSAEEWNQVYVPVGFAHGFCTLEDDTEVVYKVTDFYSAGHDRGVVWNDPDLAIAWPVSEGEAILSDKDRRLPRLRDLPAYF